MKVYALVVKSGSIAIFTASCHSEMGSFVCQPPQAQSHPLPVLYYLLGLICRSENFTIQADIQNFPVTPHKTGIFGHSMEGHGACR